MGLPEQHLLSERACCVKTACECSKLGFHAFGSKHGIRYHEVEHVERNGCTAAPDECVAVEKDVHVWEFPSEA